MIEAVDLPSGDGFDTHVPGSQVPAVEPAPSAGGATDGFDTHMPGSLVSERQPRSPVAPEPPSEAASGVASEAASGVASLAASSDLVLPKALEQQGVGRHVTGARVRVPSEPRLPSAAPVGYDSALFRPPVEPERDRWTWFLPVLGEALVLPFLPSSLIASVGGGVLLGGALLLLEAAPQLGAVVTLVVLAELSAVRLKTIRESAAGRPGVVWPDWSEGLAGFALHGASLLLFAPALVAALVAWGPEAWDRRSPGSIPATLRRTFVGEAERAVARAFLEAKKPRPKDPLPGTPGAPDAASPKVVDYLLDPELPFEPARRPQEPGEKLLEELAGSGESPAPAPSASVALARFSARARLVCDLRGASGAGLAARWLLLAGAILFPVGLLLAARVQSAGAVLDPRLLLRPIVRAPLAYALVLALFAAQDFAVCLLGFVGEPAILGLVGRPLAAHVLAVLVGSSVAVTLSVATGAAVGGFARGRRVAL